LLLPLRLAGLLLLMLLLLLPPSDKVMVVPAAYVSMPGTVKTLLCTSTIKSLAQLLFGAGRSAYTILSTASTARLTAVSCSLSAVTASLRLPEKLQHCLSHRLERRQCCVSQPLHMYPSAHHLAGCLQQQVSALVNSRHGGHVATRCQRLSNQWLQVHCQFSVCVTSSHQAVGPMLATGTWAQLPRPIALKATLSGRLPHSPCCCFLCLVDFPILLAPAAAPPLVVASTVAAGIFLLFLLFVPLPHW